MAAKKSAPPKAPPRPEGRPSKYRPEYCQDIIDHMKNGGHLQAFGAYIGDKYGREYAVCYDTICEWCKVHPAFSDAKRIGVGYSHKFYDDLARAGMSGSLRRLKARAPMLNNAGEPVTDPKTGEVMYREEYEPASFNATAWVFTRKNCHGWKDRMEHSGSIKTGGFGDRMSRVLKDPSLAAAALKLAEAMDEADGE